MLIDNLAALRAEFDDLEGMELMDELARVYADGPEAGIHVAVTADRPNTVPTAWVAVTTQKWLFRLADTYDYVSLGLTVKDAPSPMPGRAVVAETRLQIQVGRPQPSLAEAVAGPLPAQHARRDADRRAADRGHARRSAPRAASARSRGGSRSASASPTSGSPSSSSTRASTRSSPGRRAAARADALDRRRGAGRAPACTSRRSRAAARRCTTARWSTASRAPAATPPRCSPSCACTPAPSSC